LHKGQEKMREDSRENGREVSKATFPFQQENVTI